MSKTTDREQTVYGGLIGTLFLGVMGTVGYQMSGLGFFLVVAFFFLVVVPLLLVLVAKTPDKIFLTIIYASVAYYFEGYTLETIKKFQEVLF